MTWDTKWALGSKQRREKQRQTSVSQRQFLINSSDNDSEDEEWIQQLERDYGKRQLKKAKWTRFEKLLLSALVCTIIFTSVLMTAMLYSRYKHGETLLEFTLGGQQFCNEKPCVEASYRISSYMNKKLDPCNSFYDYACGTWLKEENIPSTHTKWTSFGLISDRNQRKLKSILDNLNTGLENSRALQKVRQYYRACLRKDFIESHGNESLITLINSVGSWAITNRSAWNDEEWNFDQILSKIHHLKSMPLFYMYVAADDKNSTHHVIQIEQAGATLSDETLYQKADGHPIVKAYKKLMLRVAVLLGADQENTLKQMNEVYEFEKKLSQLYESKKNLQDADQIYHKMTIADLQTLCPAIPWLDYMNSMFREPVKSNENIIVYTPIYFKKMSDLVIRTERRIIANYMVWHLIKPILPLLSKPYRNAALEFALKETGMMGNVESWKNCVTKTDSVLGFATGHLFIKELEKEEKYSKFEVERMLQMIKEEFVLNLHSVKWMDDVTRKTAIEKASSVISMVGFPDWIKNTEKLDKYYENFAISDNPLMNYFKARQFYHEKTMQRRGQSVQRNEWHISPTEVNAYYNSPNNYIALPAGVLQSPFFDEGYPKSVNYGAIGFIMAHELTHGFDSQGRHFDKSGNLRNWWTNASSLGFINQTKCLQTQYEQADVKKSSELTLPENIADNGGLKIAYNVCFQWAHHGQVTLKQRCINFTDVVSTLLDHDAFKSNEYMHGSAKYLPGLKLNPDQLFFLSFAQTWCSLATSEKREQLRGMDTHSSEKTRVDIAVSNMVDFTKTFHCPVGSRMNPAKRCSIW